MQVFGQHELKNLAHIEAQGIALSLRDDANICHVHQRIVDACVTSKNALLGDFAMYRRLTVTNEQVVLEPLLRDFELNLLEDLGYGVDFTLDMQLSEPIRANQCYLPYNRAGICTR